MEAATRCAEENLSKTRCAKLLPRLVRTHGPAGRAIALACGSTLGPKLERMREMKERVKAAEAFNKERYWYIFQRGDLFLLAITCVWRLH